MNSTGTTCPANSTANTTHQLPDGVARQPGTIINSINVFNVGLGYKF